MVMEMVGRVVARFEDWNRRSHCRRVVVVVVGRRNSSPFSSRFLPGMSRGKSSNSRESRLFAYIFIFA